MKFSNYLMLVVFGVFLTFFVSACDGDVLNINPEDVITPAIFPENEDDLDLLLNGVYSTLRETSIYNQGLFGFGILDGATPNRSEEHTSELQSRGHLVCRLLLE